MISLIIISAITAAFVPVMTKKISKGSVNITPKLTITQNCPMFTHPSQGGTSSSSCGKCAFCDIQRASQRCIICNCNCDSGTLDRIGTFKNSNDCTCRSCTEIDSKCMVCTTGAICTACQRGYYLSNNTCTICPAGYYCPDGVNKKPCEAGYYCTGRNNRTPCPAGTYSNTQNATSSSICVRVCPENCATCDDYANCTSCVSDEYILEIYEYPFSCIHYTWCGANGKGLVCKGYQFYYPNGNGACSNCV